MLQCKNLTIMRQDVPIIADVSFTVKCGDIVQISGKNGVGKSTLMRCLAGLLPYDHGEICYHGKARPSLNIFSGEFWYLPTQTSFRSELTVQEHIDLLMDLHQIENPIDLRYMHDLHLHHLSKNSIKALSSGQQRKLQILSLFCETRPIWLLDEVFVGLDTETILWLSDQIQQQSCHAGAVIYVSHQELPFKPHKVIELS